MESTDSSNCQDVATWYDADSEMEVHELKKTIAEIERRVKALPWWNSSWSFGHDGPDSFYITKEEWEYPLEMWVTKFNAEGLIETGDCAFAFDPFLDYEDSPSLPSEVFSVVHKIAPDFGIDESYVIESFSITADNAICHYEETLVKPVIDFFDKFGRHGDMLTEGLRQFAAREKNPKPIVEEEQMQTKDSAPNNIQITPSTSGIYGDLEDTISMIEQRVRALSLWDGTWRFLREQDHSVFISNKQWKKLREDYLLKVGIINFTSNSLLDSLPERPSYNPTHLSVWTAGASPSLKHDLGALLQSIDLPWAVEVSDSPSLMSVPLTVTHLDLIERSEEQVMRPIIHFFDTFGKLGNKLAETMTHPRGAGPFLW